MIASGAHRSRCLTALVGLPLLGACLWLGGWFFFFLVLAVTLAALWEFHGLFPAGGPCVRGLSLALGALMVWLGFRFGPGAALAVVPAAFWLEEIVRLWHDRPGSPRWLLSASLIYLPGSLQFLCSFSPAETTLVLAVVMASDTGAYYAGHLIGGPKIWPRVSPKKTWAGSLGGLTASAAVCLAAGALWGKAQPWTYALLGAALSVAGQMGDFLESAWKRASDVKDSGSILPGHGGLLDRIDALIPAVLVYALARTLVPFP